MAENRTEGVSPGVSSNNTRPLIESFNEYVDSIPHSEVEDLSNQLNIALGAITTSKQQPNNTRSSTGLSGGGGLRRTSGSQQRQQAAASTGRMLLSRPPSAVVKEDKTPSLGRGAASTREIKASSTGQLNNKKRLPSNSRRASNMGKGVASSCAAIIPKWDGNYKPKSSSRRHSREGSALSMSMKLSAQNMLADLGEVSDDDEDEDWLQLSLLNEGNMSGIIEGVGV